MRQIYDFQIRVKFQAVLKTLNENARKVVLLEMELPEACEVLELVGFHLIHVRRLLLD